MGGSVGCLIRFAKERLTDCSVLKRRSFARLVRDVWFVLSDLDTFVLLTENGGFTVGEQEVSRPLVFGF